MKADSTSTSTAQQRARTGLCPCQLLEARDKDDDKIIQETKTHMQTREETMCKFVYRERERERERELFSQVQTTSNLEKNSACRLTYQLHNATKHKTQASFFFYSDYICRRITFIHFARQTNITLEKLSN